MRFSSLVVLAYSGPFLILALHGGCSRSVPGSQSGETEQPSRLSVRAEGSHVIESLPLASLAPDTQAQESTGALFARRRSEDTGVDFTHRWSPRTIAEKALFDGPFTGGGVAIGDYDADGLPDLFLTRPYGGNRLFRNLGGFKFEDTTQQAGLTQELSEDAWGTGPTFADVNGDGHLDLYVCAYGQPNRLYVNDGRGGFREQAARFGLDFSGASVTMAFADYDLDGDLDAFLVTYRKIQEVPPLKLNFEMRAGRFRVEKKYQELHDILLRGPERNVMLIPAGQLDHLYRNEGGQFVEVTEQALGNASQDGYFGLSARWWDFNSDRYPDLYVSNDFFGSDQLFRNNGDGTFDEIAKEALPYTPWFSMGTDVADVNNDGRLDLMAADMAGTSHYKSKLNMGDMDQNGWFLESAEPRQYMSNALYLNTGTERFQEGASMAGVASSDWTWALKFADFDLDGHTDLYATNGMTRNWFNGDLRARAAEESTAARVSWLERWGDEPRLDEENVAFRNEGDLKFTKRGDDWGLNHIGISYGAAVGDLDGDGDPDIVTVNFDEPVHVYENRTKDKARITVKLRGTRSNRFAVGAKVTLRCGDRIQCRDVATSRGFFSADDTQIQFGLGDAQKVDELVIDWPSGHRQVFSNLKANRKYIVREPAETPAANTPAQQPAPMFARNQGFPSLQHEEADFDDFEREPLLPNRMSRLGPGIACGDIQGDGKLDFYMAGAKGFAGKFAVGGKRGYRRKPNRTNEADREREEMGALLFDADGDGDADLYLVSGGVECEPGSPALQDVLLLNDGSGEFQPAESTTLPEMLESGGSVCAADFDRDGDLDLFVGGRCVPGKYPEPPTSYLLRNNGKVFADVSANVAEGLSDIGMVTSGLWTDVDADGWLDLMVTSEWGPIRLFKNRQGELVEETDRAGLAEYRGWWNGITGRDFDNDGDIDYVATNFGINNKYHPKPDEPVLLFYGDMAGDGTQAIVEAKCHLSDLLPVRGRSCSTKAMPHLAEKFDSFHEFASANLKEIYDIQIEKAARYEANVLESGILLNDGKGNFNFEPLPRIAQIAPGFGAAATDVNADGACDLFIVQNFYHPQRETVRMSAGVSQLLLGDGHGGFKPVDPAASNLVIPGDAKALAVADTNGDSRPDFVVTQNGGQILSFENEMGTHNESAIALSVKLVGPKGNPDAIGARVAVTALNSNDKRATQTAEVYAGSGYLSQSSSELFFGIDQNEGESTQYRIDIRWPDGQQSSSTQSGGGRVILRHPKL